MIGATVRAQQGKTQIAGIRVFELGYSAARKGNKHALTQADTVDVVVILKFNLWRYFFMLKTCDKHITSDGETAIVVYESYSRSYNVAKCPFCELAEQMAIIKDRDNEPEYHAEAMGCGLEDRNITDRYEAMEYGWERAMERIYSDVIG